MKTTTFEALDNSQIRFTHTRPLNKDERILFKKLKSKKWTLVKCFEKDNDMIFIAKFTLTVLGVFWFRNTMVHESDGGYLLVATKKMSKNEYDTLLKKFL